MEGGWISKLHCAGIYYAQKYPTQGRFVLGVVLIFAGLVGVLRPVVPLTQQRSWYS